MKGLKDFIIKGVIIGGSAWDFIKEIIWNGFVKGGVSLDTMSLPELSSFVLSHGLWKVLIVYGLILLGIFFQKKIQHANAEKKKKESEKRKQEIRDVLQEILG